MSAPPPPAPMHLAIRSWFLGPRGENADEFKQMLTTAVDGQLVARHGYFPTDNDFFPAEMKSTETFKETMAKAKAELAALSDGLAKNSVPFWSPRYGTHMLMDSSLPAILGYFTTMLYNANNGTEEASGITTTIEVDAGLQLSKVLGYNVDSTVTSEPLAWGHITCGGTVANIESMWAARNLKFYPLSLRLAMKETGPLAFVSSTFEIETCVGQIKLLESLTTWELLNLKVATILDIPEKLQMQYSVSSKYLEDALRPYSIQTVGKTALENKFGVSHTPQYMASSTKHYSWPKSGALTGIGSDNIVNVGVDIDARLDTENLEALLEESLLRQQAVYAVVAVIGTTEEGAVDPLDKILSLREKFQQRGMSFAIHADAAWGGYFTSLVREEFPEPPLPFPPKERFGAPPSGFVPPITLPVHTEEQLLRLKHADSITLDPHKAGYTPYPAGALCYKDNRMRYQVTWTTPYITRDTGSGVAESVGNYSLEGSKPGAAAVSTYMTNRVIGLHKGGYGHLLDTASFNCRRLSAHWATMKTKDFFVIPFNMLPSEKKPDATPASIEKEKQFIRDNILDKQNWELNPADPQSDQKTIKLFRELGSDLVINGLACNFFLEDGGINQDVEEANYLNRRIVERLSISTPQDGLSVVPFFLSSTVFPQKDYGVCATNFKTRLGLIGPQDLFVIRNVSMGPWSSDFNPTADLAGHFREAASIEVEYSKKRNTISEDAHGFVVQGTNSIYLVYQSNFFMRNQRQQLIVKADLPEPAKSQYLAAKAANPTGISYVKTPANTKILLSKILADGQFTATLTKADGITIDKVKVTNISVLKNRPLDSRYRDSAYPKDYMPFYIYGNPDDAMIDHMLLFSPNIQLSAEVSLPVTESNTALRRRGLRASPYLATVLAQGGLAMIKGLHEAAMQPFNEITADTSNPNFFFAPGMSYEVYIYEDPRGSFADQDHPTGPGLDVVNWADWVAKGKLTLKKGIVVDNVGVNEDRFADSIGGPNNRRPKAGTNPFREEVDRIFPPKEGVGRY
ncbi:PLP-dependent transferase [Choiromyces venosus 120613-1]|uniref:PLP-dependent transferase n=1 Tax=Choiromyces venosus 120613-1 TaxID=1336337 RepID=A0A3N4J3W2_9PEZI|nr:PLP-dependent transferase [Choiromyces venosus 120613-1]